MFGVNTASPTVLKVAGTGVPGQFTVAYYRWFDDCFHAESTIHEMLLDVRVDPAREFFRIDVREAVQLGMTSELLDSFVSGLVWHQPKTRQAI